MRAQRVHSAHRLLLQQESSKLVRAYQCCHEHVKWRGCALKDPSSIQAEMCDTEERLEREAAELDMQWKKMQCCL